MIWHSTHSHVGLDTIQFCYVVWCVLIDEKNEWTLINTRQVAIEMDYLEIPYELH